MNDNDFNKQEEVDKKAKAKEGFSNFLKKTSEGIQKGAKNVSEFTQKTIHDQKMKYYNPLFKEEFKSKTFKLPKVIQIVSEVSRRDVDVCEGAIGWTSTVNDVEILHIYEEYAKLCKVQFVPFEKVDAIYCADNFDKDKYINSDAIFERAMNEKLTELENIAYCLGAVSCSIELIESDGQAESSRIKIGAKKAGNVDSSASSSSSNKHSGKNTSTFAGHDNPTRPELKWFKYDDNINALIDRKVADSGSVTYKVLELKGSSSATMSQKTACAIDKIAKCSISVEKKAVKEHSSTLIFEIEF